MQHISMIDAFAMINNVLHQSVKGIADIIAKPGHINVDFADVKAIMKDMGLAVMGTGCASGPERGYEAALQAITSPLLENMSIKGARGVLLNITGGPSLTLHEISQAASLIYEQADQNATIIIGSVIEPALDEEIYITVIATGFSPHITEEKKECAPQPSIAKAADKIAEPIKEPLLYKEHPSMSENPEKEPAPSKDFEEIPDLDIPTFLRKKEQYSQEL